MFTLYIDNFRGFSDTFIKLSDVNFFVGENSTGKTSILSLLYLLNTPQFYFQPNFNHDFIQLGNFNDIVSSNAVDKSYFKIGLIEFIEEPEKDKFFISNIFLMKFVNKKGIPELNQYFLINNKYSISIRFSDEFFEYSLEKIEFTNNIESDIINLFNKWIKFDFKNNNKKKISIKTNPIELPKDIILKFIDNNENNIGLNIRMEFLKSTEKNFLDRTNQDKTSSHL